MRYESKLRRSCSYAVDAKIPEDLRRFLLDSGERLRRALAEYPRRGASAIREATEAVSVAS